MGIASVAARRAETTNPVSIVLEAEQAALSGVEHFRRQTLQMLVTSALRAVLVHKRAEARIERLRQRMTADAQLRRGQIACEMTALEVDMSVDKAPLMPMDNAIARVAAELAGVSESS